MELAQEQQDFYTLMEFARRNRIGISTTYNEIKAGRLTARKIGRRTIITADAEKIWHDRLSIKQPSAAQSTQQKCPTPSTPGKKSSAMSGLLRRETSRKSSAPAMIAAFGVADEPEPGAIIIAENAIRGVHLTKLASDGSGKAGSDNDKIIIGKCLRSPIVLAPPNDLMGMAVTEGIENGLSMFVATGLGVWAAGAASRMPMLADTSRCTSMTIQQACRTPMNSWSASGLVAFTAISSWRRST